MNYNVEFSKEEWELIRDATADIACWHRGFKSANPNYDPPPQLEELVNLVSKTKSEINRMKSSNQPNLNF